MKRWLLLILGLVSVNSDAELSGEYIALKRFDCQNSSCLTYPISTFSFLKEYFC